MTAAQITTAKLARTRRMVRHNAWLLAMAAAGYGWTAAAQLVVEDLAMQVPVGGMGGPAS